MNFSTTALVVATLGLGSTSAYLYTQLNAERSRADAAHQESKTRIAELQRARSQLERDVEALLLNRTGRPAYGSAGPAPATHPTLATAGAAVEKVTNEERRKFRGRGPLQNMLATPAGREMMRTQNKMIMRRMYKDLAKELGLSTDQANQVMDLLAEQQIRQIEALQQEGNNDRGEDRARTLSDLREKNETELMGLLGDKYLQYENYQKSLGERMQVEQMRDQFEAANTPLRDDQKEQLLTAMVEERDRKARPAWSEGLSQKENIERQKQWQEDYNRRVRERVAGTLTPEQIKQYDELQKMQSTMQQMGFGMMRRGGGAMMTPGQFIMAAPSAAR